MAVLSFTGLADAKHAKRNKPIRGTIATLNGNTFTLTTGGGGKKSTKPVVTYTIDSSTAKITGGTLAVGEKVSVTGTISGTNITAFTVKLGKHHKKKPA